VWRPACETAAQPAALAVVAPDDRAAIPNFELFWTASGVPDIRPSPTAAPIHFASSGECGL